MSLQFWKSRSPRQNSTLKRGRRSRSLRSIRVVERCEDRTLMATALGVTGGNALIRFDTATPGIIDATTPITGLAGGDAIVGLDFRPATGQLYGLGSGSRLYTIDPSTGAATQAGSNGAFTLNGASFGFNFNPVPDRLRVTSDSDQNLRLNPNDGTLTATDGTLAYALGDPNSAANPNVVASAYINSFGGSTATTLYDIDSNLDTLVIQNPPNSGTLNTLVGAGLGVDIQGPAGFDIQALTGGGNAAFASLTTDGTSSSLYTINLLTGAATLVGGIGASSTLVGSLAIVPQITPSAVLYGINAANGNLVHVNSSNPTTIIGSIPITGLAGGDTIVGLDFRPATGQLYGLGSGSRLYTIDPITGAATQVGSDGAFALDGSNFYGFDFNPTVDRIRITSINGQNIRVNPNDGTLAASDGTLAYAAGDSNNGNAPSITEVAYTNSFAGATSTTLYDLDTALKVLATQNPPNSGTVNTVGSLGSLTGSTFNTGFDIQALPGGGNVAFAALGFAGGSSLYTIDLTTGAATQVGTGFIGGTTPLTLNGLAVAPFGSFSLGAPTYSVGEAGPVATVTVNRAQGSEGVATVRLTTSDGTATTPGDYTPFDQVLIFAPGVTTQTVQIAIVNDPVAEPDKTVNLTLTAATGGAVLDTQSTAVLTILDDDTAPVAVDDVYSTGEDSTLTIAAPGLLANDTDADGGTLTAVLVVGPAQGTLTPNPDGSLTYTPAANFNGPVTFTYSASDGVNTSNVATVTILVTPVDDAPVSADDSYTTAEGSPLTVAAPGLLANDTDADADPLTAVVVAGPAHGSLTLNPDGSFTYTPVALYFGPDSFTYNASDGSLAGNTGTVSLTVTRVNHAPVAVADSYTTTSGGAPLTVAAPGLLANDTDAEGDPLTAILVAGPTHGTLALNPDGSFTYTPESLYSGPDSFSYSAFDGLLLSNVATVGLSVTHVNRAPVAVADTYTTTAGATPLTVAAPGLLSNDTDPDLDPLTVLLVSSPAHGQVGFNADGSFTYTPNALFSGTDSFSYRAFDGSLTSNLATVSLTINAASTPKPAVTNDYDGDGKSDVAVYLTESGAFGLGLTGGGPNQIIPFGIGGAGQSIPVSGDFDGDGKADLAVYLPSLANLVYRPSSGGADVYNYFGIAGQGRTIPAPGDYFGTGKTDVAAYFPESGTFAIRNPAGGPDTYYSFGLAGAGQSIPDPGDFDGDGKADLAVYMPALGAFGIRPSGGGADRLIPFGIAGAGQSIPVSGDFDGDGKADLAVYLPSLANLVYRPSAGGADVYNYFGFAGQGQTLPAPGDYNGVGHTQVAAYLPSAGSFALRPGGGLPDSVFPFGIPGAGQTIPVTVVDQALTEIAPRASAASIPIPDSVPADDFLSASALSTTKKKIKA